MGQALEEVVDDCRASWSRTLPIREKRFEGTGRDREDWDVGDNYGAEGVGRPGVTVEEPGRREAGV